MKIDIACHFNTFYYETIVLQKFCVTNPFSAMNRQMGLKPKQLYSPGYNSLFDVITILSDLVRHFVVLINEFVGACGIPCRVFLFGSLPLWGSLFILVHSTSNLCTSVPTHTDLSVHVRIFFKNPFLYRFLYQFFLKIWIFGLSYGFFLRDHFYRFY